MALLANRDAIVVVRLKEVDAVDAEVEPVMDEMRF